MCTFDLGVLMTDEAPLQVGPPKIELSITVMIRVPQVVGNSQLSTVSLFKSQNH